MDRTWREATVEAATVIASLVLVLALGVAVLGAVTIDRGPDSTDCPPRAGAPGDDASGTATWQWSPMGLRCTYDAGGGEPAGTTYDDRGVMLGLLGGAGAAVVLVALRRRAATLQRDRERAHPILFADQLPPARGRLASLIGRPAAPPAGRRTGPRRPPT